MTFHKNLNSNNFFNIKINPPIQNSFQIEQQKSHKLIPNSSSKQQAKDKMHFNSTFNNIQTAFPQSKSVKPNNSVSQIQLDKKPCFSDRYKHQHKSSVDSGGGIEDINFKNFITLPEQIPDLQSDPFVSMDHLRSKRIDKIIQFRQSCNTTNNFSTMSGFRRRRKLLNQESQYEDSGSRESVQELMTQLQYNKDETNKYQNILQAVQSNKIKSFENELKQQNHMLQQIQNKIRIKPKYNSFLQNAFNQYSKAISQQKLQSMLKIREEEVKVNFKKQTHPHNLSSNNSNNNQINEDKPYTEFTRIAINSNSSNNKSGNTNIYGKSSNEANTHIYKINYNTSSNNNNCNHDNNNNNIKSNECGSLSDRRNKSEQHSIHIVAKCFVQIGCCKNWKPPGIIGSTLTCFGDYIFVIGGQSFQINSDVLIYKMKQQIWFSLMQIERGVQSDEEISKLLKSQPQQSQFQPTPCPQSSQCQLQQEKCQQGQDLAQQQQQFNQQAQVLQQQINLNAAKKCVFKGRFNHTANVFQNYILIFGGESYYVTKHIKTECLNDVWLFDMKALQWSLLNTYGDIVQGRRHHSATIIGNFLLIYGGINVSEKYLNDLMVLDLATQKWTDCTLKMLKNDSHIYNKYGVAYHHCCAVYENISTQKLFSKGDKSDKNSSNGSQLQWKQIREEGIYFYGGKSSIVRVYDQVLILKTGNTFLQWKIAKTTGKSPGPRYGHSMSYVDRVNVIAIYGGQNDGDQDDEFFSQIFLLDLFNLEWKKVQMLGNYKLSRSYHGAVVNGSQIVIFGGLNNSQYVKPEITTIELNQHKVKNLIQIYDQFNISEQQIQHQIGQDLNQSLVSNQHNVSNSLIQPKLIYGQAEILTHFVKTFLPIPNNSSVLKRKKWEQASVQIMEQNPTQ